MLAPTPHAPLGNSKVAQLMEENHEPQAQNDHERFAKTGQETAGSQNDQ